MLVAVDHGTDAVAVALHRVDRRTKDQLDAVILERGRELGGRVGVGTEARCVPPGRQW